MLILPDRRAFLIPIVHVSKKDNPNRKTPVRSISCAVRFSLPSSWQQCFSPQVERLQQLVILNKVNLLRHVVFDPLQNSSNWSDGKMNGCGAFSFGVS
jgi:hypothetical protein